MNFFFYFNRLFWIVFTRCRNERSAFVKEFLNHSNFSSLNNLFIWTYFILIFIRSIIKLIDQFKSWNISIFSYELISKRFGNNFCNFIITRLSTFIIYFLHEKADHVQWYNAPNMSVRHIIFFIYLCVRKITIIATAEEIIKYKTKELIDFLRSWRLRKFRKEEV